MDLLPTEEQNQIVDASVGFLEKELPVERMLQSGEQPLIDRTMLGKIAELGWFGIGLSEDLGGVGYGLREETLLCVEMGRYLVSPAVLGSILGTRLAAVAGDEELAASIMAGEKLVAVAIPRYSQTPVVDNTVTGEYYVFEGDDADLVLIVDDNASALVEKSAISIFKALPCTDDKMQFAAASCENVSTVAALKKSDEDIYLRGVLLTAAMQLGIAEATRDRCVEYAKVREQYGKPIGAFQAIKHYCAEMAVKCEASLSQIYVAAIELEDPAKAQGDNAVFDTLCAKTLASDAAMDNANTAVQVHGGMGFTQEMDIHLFVKRAHVLDQLFGTQRKQLQQLSKLAGPAL